MNVFDILRKLGYDIISINDGVYTVRNTTEKIKDLLNESNEARAEESQETLNTQEDIFETWNLVVSDLKFNGFGNLCVSFKRVEYPDECWDVYEYRNMDKEYTSN